MTMQPMQAPQPQRRQVDEQVEEYIIEEHIVEQPQQVPTTERRRGGGGGGDGGETRRTGERAQPSGRVAFASYENVFLLCGAINAALFLRQSLSERAEDGIDRGGLVQEFWLLEAEIPILTASPWPISSPYFFGIYEPSAISILRAAAANPRSPPSSIELTIAPVGDEDLVGQGIVMQGDGLTLLPWPRGPLQVKRWDLPKGEWT